MVIRSSLSARSEIPLFASPSSRDTRYSLATRVGGTRTREAPREYLILLVTRYVRSSVHTGYRKRFNAGTIREKINAHLESEGDPKPPSPRSRVLTFERTLVRTLFRFVHRRQTCTLDFHEKSSLRFSENETFGHVELCARLVCLGFYYFILFSWSSRQLDSRGCLRFIVFSPSYCPVILSRLCSDKTRRDSNWRPRT